jgi:hypothetical protein
MPSSILNYGNQKGSLQFNDNYNGDVMKFWAFAGFLASAVLLTVFVHHKDQKEKNTIKDPDKRYGIDELLMDLDA